MVTIWIITKNGFISLVQDRDNPNMLQVRARVREDIERHFPTAYIRAVDGADYRYRARISKARVADKLATMVLDELTYTSHFKDVAIAMDRGNMGRRTAYYAVWTALAGMQDWAPYATRSRAAQQQWNRVHKEQYPALYSTRPRPPYSSDAQPKLPTFQEARAIPGNPWSTGNYTAPSISRDDNAREPEVWEQDVDMPDDSEDDGLLFDNDSWEDPVEAELDAVEEAFDVNSRSLSDEDLQTMIATLRNIGYMDQPSQSRRKSGARVRRKRHHKR